MNEPLLLVGIVILICVLIHRWTEKLPVPSLLIFLGLGMLFGENGILRIPFDDYLMSEWICSIALVFIIYYGGFGINLKEAKKVIVPSVLLSTIGVVLTTVFVGLFVHWTLKLSLLEGMLIGAVISSTDAASVFSVLRAQKLSLKYSTDSMLEMESGSNDPFSYMLTVVFTALLLAQEVSIPLLLISQVVFGCLAGILMGKIGVYALHRLNTSLDQAETILVVATVLIAYALPAVFGGNGYISVYLCGIIMGNADIPKKKEHVHFFDTLTGIAQMLIFFLLGLLVTPMNLSEVFVPALVIMLFLTFVARPLAVSLLLAFNQSKIKQIGLVSWAGFRGAASIVFAIYVVVRNVAMTYPLFNLVFCIVLLSIAIQGSLLPFVSRVLKMIDYDKNIQRTFNDYQENTAINFVRLHIDEGHKWEGKLIRELELPNEILIVLLVRNQLDLVVPRGDTKIEKGDLLVLAGQEFDDRSQLMLQEVVIGNNHKWNHRSLSDIAMKNGLIVMLQRGKDTIVPSGDTILQEDDVLVIAKF